MKKYNIIVGLSIILILTLSLSGCQEETNNNNNEGDSNVIFLSKDLQILELVNSSLEIVEDNNEEIVSVQVLFRFRNLLDKTIRNLSIDISYYDINEVLLGNSTFSYFNLPPNWIEASSNRPEVFNEEGVETFDHVKLRIINYEIIE